MSLDADFSGVAPSSGALMPLDDTPVEVDPAAAAAELADMLAGKSDPQPCSTGTLIPVLAPIVIEAVESNATFSTVCLTPLPEPGTALEPEVIGLANTFLAMPMEAPLPYSAPEVVPTYATPNIESVTVPVAIPIPIEVATAAPQAIVAATTVTVAPPVVEAAAVVNTTVAAAPLIELKPIAPGEPLVVRIRSRLRMLAAELAAVPFWFVSFAFHGLLIALVTLVSMTIELPKEEAVVVTTELIKAVEAPKERAHVDPSALMDVNEKPVVDATSKDALLKPADILDISHADLGDHFETNNPTLADTHSAFGDTDSHLFTARDQELERPGGGGTDGASLVDMVGVGSFGHRGTGGGFGGGKGTGIGTDVGSGGGAFGQRNAGGRKVMVERHGGSPATESAVAKALQWLAYHQNPNGSWGDQQRDPIAFCTSIATLAFLGAGHSERAGDYKENVRKSVAFLRTISMTPRGLPVGAYNRNDGYSQAVITMALSEAAGMSNLPETKAAAQLCVDYCVNVHQSGSGSERGGWRYQPKMPGDLSVSGWFIMALKSAKAAGLHVDTLAFEGAKRFVDSTRTKLDDPDIDKGYGPAFSFNYTPVMNQNPLPNLKQLPPGMLKRMYMGSECCQAIGNLCSQFMRRQAGRSSQQHSMVRKTIRNAESRRRKYVLLVLRHALHVSARRRYLDEVE